MNPYTCIFENEACFSGSVLAYCPQVNGIFRYQKRQGFKNGPQNRVFEL